MKKLSVVVILSLSLFFGCSKNPLGPSMSGMGAPAVGRTGSSTGSSDPSTAGATSVSSAETNTVTAQQNGAGVTSMDLSTGVNSSVSGNLNATGTVTSSGGTLNIVISEGFASLAGASPNLTVNAGAAPRIAWTFSGITGVGRAIGITVTKVTPSLTAWSLDLDSNIASSAIYGVVPEGATGLAAPKPLSSGIYIVYLHSYIRDSFTYTAYDGIGTITVN